MRLNDNFKITKHSNKIFLVNIENGDVYEINDVTESVLNLINDGKNLDDVINITYDIYKDGNNSYTKKDLQGFIDLLKNNKVIL